MRAARLYSLARRNRRGMKNGSSQRGAGALGAFRRRGGCSTRMFPCAASICAAHRCSSSVRLPISRIRISFPSPTNSEQRRRRHGRLPFDPGRRRHDDVLRSKRAVYDEVRQSLHERSDHAGRAARRGSRAAILVRCRRRTVRSKCSCTAPLAPVNVGTATKLVDRRPAASVSSTSRSRFGSGASLINVFAGGRRDPDFFQRVAVLQHLSRSQSREHGAELSAGRLRIRVRKVSTRRLGVDYFANSNVLSIVVEVPRTLLAGTGNGVVAYWATTSTTSGQ